MKTFLITQTTKISDGMCFLKNNIKLILVLTTRFHHLKNSYPFVHKYSSAALSVL